MADNVTNTTNTDNTYEVDHVILEPINPTDPIVHHDRSKAYDSIATPDEESDQTLREDMPKPDIGVDSTRINGIFFPIINLNGIVLRPELVQEMVIEVKDFAPTLYLTIYDEQERVVGKNRPTMNNFITIIMAPPVDGTYKSISMKFYIKSFDIIGDNLYSYTGTYHWMELYNQTTRHIKFPGCSSKWCNRPANNKPSTWEYLHVIALENGLGFSSTEDCRQHNDCLPRLVQAKTAVDFIQEHVEFGGMDADHIFDVYIDEYGYLTQINLPWVMNYDLSPDNLAINKITAPAQSTKKLPDPKHKLVHRTITNYTAMDEYNGDLFIEWYEEINNNSSTFFNGTQIQMYGFKPKGSECSTVNGSSGNNAFSQKDIQIQEDSIVGKALEEYNTSTKIIVKPEYNSYQTELQKIVRDNYLRKMKTKVLKVRLRDMNFGLHRGILVNVMLFTDNPELKDKYMRSFSNVIDNQDEITDENTIGVDKYNIITNANAMVPDPWLSGIYYVMGVEYVYDPFGTGTSDQKYKDYIQNELGHSDDHLLQYLYLVRRKDPDSPGGLKRPTKMNFTSMKNE